MNGTKRRYWQDEVQVLLNISRLVVSVIWYTFRVQGQHKVFFRAVLMMHLRSIGNV